MSSSDRWRRWARLHNQRPHPSTPRTTAGRMPTSETNLVIRFTLLQFDHCIHGFQQLSETCMAVILRVKGGVEALDHRQDSRFVDPWLALGISEQVNRSAQQVCCLVGRGLGDRIGSFVRPCLGGCLLLDEAFVVPELMATLGPVLVRVLAVTDADERAAGSLDLLGHGHAVAVAINDDDCANVTKAPDVFCCVKTALDVGAVFGRCSGGERVGSARRRSGARHLGSVRNTASCHRRG